MNKLIFYLLVFALTGACTEKVIHEDDLTIGSTAASRTCAAMDVLKTKVAEDPKLAARMAAIEEHTRVFRESGGLKGKPSSKITIPVVVNILYRTDAENISLAQVQSQIDVLNEDFNATNADISQTPAEFAGTVAAFEIEFVLQNVVRKYSSKRSWQLNDFMKYSKFGGIDATNPQEYLNMWVVNSLGQGRYLGYAQFPGGDPATDGVVVAHSFFGRTGTVLSPYDKGRTATHEVGHWLNLRHIWGDATCGNDLVADTPEHNTYNFGCPTYPHLSTCAGSPTEMTMNYMDYTDDPCMFMFTQGQKERSLAVFAPGGPRASFVQN